MLIIRVAFAADNVPSLHSGSGQQANITTDRFGRNQDRRVRAFGSNGVELKSLAVEITRCVETDVDTIPGTDADRKVSNPLDDANGTTAIGSPTTMKSDSSSVRV